MRGDAKKKGHLGRKKRRNKYSPDKVVAKKKETTSTEKAPEQREQS